MQEQGKILSVDDDLNNIAIVKELLEDSYDVKTVTSGEEALEIAQEFQPDIILLDIMMPGMNGYEICQRLRKRYTPDQMKIIMVSAKAMVTERLEGYNAGADDYITKPFDGDEFLAKIKFYIDLKLAEEMDHTDFEIASTAIDELKIPVLAAKNIISDVSSNVYGAVNKQIHHQLEIANDCIDIIKSTTSNIHDILEIHQSKLELKQSIFSMQSVVLKVIDILNPKVTLRNISFSIDMPSEDLLVNADYKNIVKILENLISHTIQGSHEGDTITVRMKGVEGKINLDVEVTITETESGKADEFYNHFDQHEKNITLSRQNEDLALVVAKRLAKLQGSSICVQYKSEGGAVFSFEIPLSSEAEVEPMLSSTKADSEKCEQLEYVNTGSKYIT